MKQFRLAVATGVTALLAVAGGYAVAQTGVEPEVEPTPASRTPVLEGAAGQEGRDLTPEEKLATAQKRIERMRGQLGQTTELLQKVREGDGDIVRINCINEKLAAMKGFVKVSEQSYTGLRDATGQDDEVAQAHHFSLISISAQKVRDLGEEAQTCVGEVQVFADEGVVDRREDPGLADVDPIVVDDDAFDDQFATETLPELTPFQ